MRGLEQTAGALGHPTVSLGGVVSVLRLLFLLCLGVGASSWGQFLGLLLGPCLWVTDGPGTHFIVRKGEK